MSLTGSVGGAAFTTASTLPEVRPAGDSPGRGPE